MFCNHMWNFEGDIDTPNVKVFAYHCSECGKSKVFTKKSSAITFEIKHEAKGRLLETKFFVRD